MSLQPVQPLSLSAQAGLLSLELIHQNCLKLENGYIKHWLPMLSQKSRDFEERLDCSKLNLERIVLKHEEMVRQKRKGLEWRAVKMHAGIPRTAGGAQTYVRYRKCSYLYTVAQWREALMSQAVMTPEMMTGLMELAVSLYRPSKDRLEPGALTLQAVLTCQWTERLLTFTTGYRSNFRAYGWETGGRDWRLEEKDTRLGHSLLVSSLSTASRLKKLCLERLATDDMMSVVSRTCPLLTFLNISSSKVTDTGLLMIAGLEEGEEERRPRLSRQCKQESQESSGAAGLVRNVPVRWRPVPGQGCSSLHHLQADNLLSLVWNKSNLLYKDYSTVPLDAGFVALLSALPLTILNTEVAGRAVLAWIRLNKKLNRKNRELGLEVLVEARPTESLLLQVSSVCPRLREVRVDWAQFVPDNTVSREAWLDSLSALPGLESLVTSEIDHKSEALNHLLTTSLGSRLTNLHLQELWSLNFSLLAAIKESCSNLQRLVIFLTVKDWTGPLGAMAGIHIERDAELQSRSGNLGKLEEVHLMGPLSSSVTRYLLDTSPELHTLTLSVDWPDPASCNILPDTRVDFLGTAYMKQVMQGNSLAKVREVHLMTQYSRGKKYLDSEFAQFIMKSLPSLQHCGCFRCWNMTLRQRREARAMAVTKNLNIVVDQDTKPRPSENVGDFRNIYEPDKMRSSCLWLPVKPMSTFSFFEEVAEMFVGPDNIWPPDFPGLADNGNIGGNNEGLDSGSDSSDDDSSDEDQEAQIGLEPICCVM